MKKDTAQITSSINPSYASKFCLPLTVAFQLFSSDISKDKHWIFGDGTDYYSRDLVVEHTYWKMPPSGNSYEMYVEIGRYILKSDGMPEFVPDYQSNTLLIPAKPTPILHYLNSPLKPTSGLPSQTRAYVEPGFSVGFFISLNDNNVKISWDWNNADPQDAPDEIDTFDMNPSHVYTAKDSGNRIVTLTVEGDEGTDTWYFPVLVLPDFSSTIVGGIEITGPDLNGLFRVDQELSFYLDPNNPSIPKIPIVGDGSPIYVWTFYSLDQKTITMIKRGQRVSSKYTQNGNYKVVLEVWNQSGNTLWWTTPINLIILDKKISITVTLSQTPAGTWQAGVTGVGFPAGRGINLTVDATALASKVNADGIGHFTTDIPIDISQLGEGTYEMTAESTWLREVTVTQPFTIPPQANMLDIK